MTTTIFLIAIVVLMFGMMIWTGSKQKKAQADFMAMLDTLRAGMRVKMSSGVIGRIKEVTEEAPGFKTVLIETGDDKNHSCLLYDINAVQGIVNEEALAQLKIRENLKELEKAEAERKAEAEKGDAPAEVAEEDPHTIKITTLNGEEFDAGKYVAKRNSAALGETAKKPTSTKSKTKK
jgi:preprotein translocase YajC subunit